MDDSGHCFGKPIRMAIGCAFFLHFSEFTYSWKVVRADPTHWWMKVLRASLSPLLSAKQGPVNERR